jgi:flagellar biosynthesis protein FlhB
MSEARIHPPSEQRLSEARRIGHVPRAPLVGVFALWASLLLGLSLSAPRLWGALVHLLRAPLEAAASGRAWSLVDLAKPGTQLLWSIAFLLLGAFVALALGTLITQGPAFGFVGASRLRPSPLRPARSSALLFAFGLPFLCAQVSARALRAEPHELTALLRDFALYLAAYLGACSLLDAALARAAHVRSLWLTRREQRDEQREAYGSPEVRRVRDRLRRELGREAKP